MIKNVGKIDRIVRLTIAAILVALSVTHVLSGTWAIIAIVVASVFILTSIIRFCPLYLPFGFKTCPTKQKK